MRRLGEFYREGKIVARTFQELISKLEDSGYSCGHYYDMSRPESNWLYIQKDGDPYEYEAEITPGYRGGYELYFSDINRTGRRLDVNDFEESYRRKSVKKRKQMRESYSDIDHNNVWDAYWIALDQLGPKTLCEEIARSMGTDALSDSLRYIFRNHEIPFMEEDMDEGCHGKKSKKNGSKRSVRETIGDGIGWFGDYKSQGLGYQTRDYLESLGWDQIYQDNDSRYPRAYLYKRFNGVNPVTIYIGEWGSVHVEFGNNPPTRGDSFYEIVDAPRNFNEIDGLDRLGKNLASGMDFDEAEDLFFRGE